MRHVQVLRLQPGAALTLFDGQGGEWQCELAAIGRRDVEVVVRAHEAIEREATRAVTLALGMPANDRMDTLVEKATELGAAAIRPLVCARSVLRVAGERAERKSAHWQAVAAAACEQCGRNRLPDIAAPASLDDSLAGRPADAATFVLSLSATARPAAAAIGALAPGRPVWVYSGPEGGLTADEESRLCRAGATPLSLGPRTLRADTAPLAILGLLTLADAIDPTS